jgi:hypothetical protein
MKAKTYGINFLVVSHFALVWTNGSPSFHLSFVAIIVIVATTKC